MADLERVEILEMPETHVLIVEPLTAVEGLRQALLADEIDVAHTSAVGDLRVPAESSAKVHDIIRRLEVTPKITKIQPRDSKTTLAV